MNDVFIRVKQMITMYDTIKKYFLKNKYYKNQRII